MSSRSVKYGVRLLCLFFGAVSVLIALSAYAQDGPHGTAEKIAIERLPAGGCPAFEDDMDLKRLAAGLESSISYYKKLPEDRQFEFGGDRFRAGRLKDGLARFLSFIRGQPSQDALKKWISHHFCVYRVGGGMASDDILYTGYYMPILNGSREKTAVYRYPIYNRPGDLVAITLEDFCDSCSRDRVVGRRSGKEVVPYYSRQTIKSRGGLEDTAAPIVWVDDPVDLFFLHVQGSGIVRLPSGRLINVHYAASNGRPYRSIGKYLIDRGKIVRKDLTMQSIRRYLKSHPALQDDIFAYNPRYVFFEEAPGGPKGCLGVELTPGRSVAMDQGRYPSGALAFIRTEKPLLDKSGRVKAWERFSRFVLNQDTGDAIKGLERVDIFWGGGRYAEAAAGRMKHPGGLYILMPKPGPSKKG